jgi:hypothetical protein
VLLEESFKKDRKLINYFFMFSHCVKACHAHIKNVNAAGHSSAIGRQQFEQRKQTILILPPDVIY